MITENQVLQYLKENNPSVYYLWLSQNNLSKSLNLRDLGKLFAEPNEYIIRDWINDNTTIRVIKRDDFNCDTNASGYDLLTTDSLLLIQAKLRASAIHLEQTRRKSKKNLLSSDTGQVRYSVGEADIYIFSRPDVSDYLNIKRWEYIAIPERELIDVKNPKYLIANVPKKIWSKYIGKASEVLESEYLCKKIKG